MANIRHPLLIALAVLVPLSASAQVNPFRGSKGTPLKSDDLAALKEATVKLLDQSHVNAGDTQSWNNPRSGAEGTVTAGHTVKRKGLACREVANDVTMPGANPQRSAKLVWCKTKDGWKLG